MAPYSAAVLPTSCHETARMLPTSMSLRCSLSEVALLMARIEAADATAYEMPMIASWGMRARRARMVEKMAAPTKVKASEIQYTQGPCGSPPVQGSRMAMVAPSAAIWARERSTKM